MTATEAPTSAVTAASDGNGGAGPPHADIRTDGRSMGQTTVPAAHARPLHAAFSRVLGTRDWQLITWDAAAAGNPDAAFTMTFHTRRGLDRLLGSLPDRGFGRAYATGELDV